MSNIQFYKINAATPVDLDSYEFEFSYWVAFDHDLEEVIERADTRKELERKLAAC